ncbi:unnamed protein product [Coffea canephora]|uniref:DH200=94 genomic scaffold, scaffold_67 n=1 Tax=Coffea canephora TaxID=49390 RepID=A0A068UW21_COFCA|nr:unnamed protein product [Coffea canephora]
MELFLLFLFFLLMVFFCFFLYSFPLSFKLKEPISKLQLPPGKTGWPIVGETLEFAAMGRNGTPEKFFKDRMSKYSQEVFKTSLLCEQIAVFCGPAANKFVFSNENKLVALSWPSSAKKIFPSSNSSTKLRAVALTLLKPDNLHKYVAIVDSIAKSHLETQWNFQKEVNVLSLVRQFDFTAACRLFLSINDPHQIEDCAKPFEVMAAGIFTLPINLPGSSYNRGIKAANSVRQKLLGIIKQRKGEVMDKQLVHDEDLLSLFLTKPDENGKFMSEPEIADHLLAALLASQDSTTASITFTMKYLAEFPDIYDEVLKEQRSIAQEKIPGEPLNWKDLQKMRYAWNVVSEVLRLVPPVQGNFREVLTDFTYSTFFIPKGWKIYWTPNSTHKNPQYFSDPEKFDPSRFEGSGPMPHTFVPFGGGSRICPGKDFARVVILVFMYNVIGKFRWEKLLPDEKTVVLPIPLPAKGLPVVLHPH